MDADFIVARYDVLAECAERCRRQNELVEDTAKQVRNDMDALRGGGWIGHGADAFYSEMDGLVLPATARLSAALVRAAHLFQEIERILRAAEEEASAPFRRNGGTAPPPVSNLTDAETDWKRAHPASSNFVYAGGNAFYKLIELIGKISNNRTATREAFRNFGRFLNLFTKHNGFVGKLDDFYKNIVVKGIPLHGDGYKFFKSPLFKVGLVAANAVLGFFSDLQKGTYGTDIGKALGVNSIDALIQYGIGAVHPIGAAALVVDAGIDVGGDLMINGQRQVIDFIGADAGMKAMMYQDTVNQQRAMDKIDLAGVTKNVSEAAFDGVRDQLSLSKEYNRVVIRGVRDMWQNPSWETFSRVNGSIVDHVWSNRGRYAGRILGPPAFLFSSAESRQNMAEAGVLAGRTADGLVDLWAASVGSQANFAVNSFTHSVNHHPLIPGGMRTAVTSTAKTAADFFQDNIVGGTIDVIDF
jgi:WXG100 family type VII secretion target